MELIRLSEKAGYISCPVNVGVVFCGGDRVALIDSALDRVQAKKLAEVLGAQGLTPIAIINTHAHADHFGGNAQLLRMYPLTVIAAEVEAAIIENPIWEPVFLFSGAMPPKDLLYKFFYGEASRVDQKLAYRTQTLTLGDTVFEMIPLPGHSPGHFGVAADGVLFCGDTLLSLDALKKHGVPFIYDVEAQLDTLERMAAMQYLFLPAHCSPLRKITDEAAAIKRVIENMSDYVFDYLADQAGTTDDLTAYVSLRCGKRITGVTGFWLDRVGVSAVLAYLYKKEKIAAVVEDNKVKWKSV